MKIIIQLDCRIFNPVKNCHGFLSSKLYKGRQLLQISRGGNFQNFPPWEYWCSTLIPPQFNICLSGFSSHVGSSFNWKNRNKTTLNRVCKSHQSNLKNVAFLSSCPSYTYKNYMHYSSIRKMRQPFINSDLYI